MRINYWSNFKSILTIHYSRINLKTVRGVACTAQNTNFHMAEEQSNNQGGNILNKTGMFAIKLFAHFKNARS